MVNNEDEIDQDTSTDSTDSTNSIHSSNRDDLTNQDDLTDSTGSTDSTDSTDSTNPTESIHSSNRNDLTNQDDLTDSTDSTSSTESEEEMIDNETQYDMDIEINDENDYADGIMEEVREYDENTTEEEGEEENQLVEGATISSSVPPLLSNPVKSELPSSPSCSPISSPKAIASPHPSIPTASSDKPTSSKPVPIEDEIISIIDCDSSSSSSSSSLEVLHSTFQHIQPKKQPISIKQDLSDINDDGNDDDNREDDSKNDNNKNTTDDNKSTPPPPNPRASALPTRFTRKIKPSQSIPSSSSSSSSSPVAKRNHQQDSDDFEDSLLNEAISGYIQACTSYPLHPASSSNDQSKPTTEQPPLPTISTVSSSSNSVPSQTNAHSNHSNSNNNRDSTRTIARKSSGGMVPHSSLNLSSISGQSSGTVLPNSLYQFPPSQPESSLSGNLPIAVSVLSSIPNEHTSLSQPEVSYHHQPPPLQQASPPVLHPPTPLELLSPQTKRRRQTVLIS